MLEYIKPNEIEKRSFDIIKGELTKPINPIYEPIILRVIHTTADFEYADTLMFSDNVLEKALNAIKSGVNIVSDTSMVKAGTDSSLLNKFGIDCFCYIKDEDVKMKALAEESTRARVTVDKAVSMGRPLIFAIGNAPTALIHICELAEKGVFKPELVIGLPVGFVNVVEAKKRLVASGIPYITNTGRKGGSNVAAAVCNALLRLA